MKNKTKKRSILTTITLSILFAVFFISINPIEKTQAGGLESAWLCRNELTKELYMMAETDYGHYLVRSKSAVANTEKVDSNVLNKILSISGFDFKETNEAILGRDLRPVSISDVTTEEANEGAPRVSAFDRFGMSGLKWSSYAGEWKYNYVDPCATVPNVSNTNYGTFYEGRLEPQSSHNETSTSRDPRSMQFDRGFDAVFASTFRDTLANSLFSISKFIVTLTITFVGLAFTDITTLIGITSDGNAGSAAAGIFIDLFNSVFSTFVFFTFILTALYLLYNGVIKKQIRLAFNTLIKTVLIFVVAVIMSTNPSFWVGVPNKIATYGQAIILNSMTSLYDTQTGYVSLCASDVASITDNTDLENTDNLVSEFGKVNQNMKSAIGCQLWEQFLFKPWVRGQFGVEYEELNNDVLGNINSRWVGNGSVPVGDGKTIDNWALFHLSTQTNAHSQVTGDNFPSYINGVNGDWWRTVDALSNYDEESITDVAGAIGENNQEVQVNVDYDAQVLVDPLKPWQSWIGNNSERLDTAIIAIIFGFVGSIAPLVFSVYSAIMGLGITLMMMTAPIFLLFGTWGGKGDGIFFGWLSTLLNMIIKRIALSFLLVFSISLTLTIMKLAYEIGMIKAFMLLVIVTILLVKNNKKILGMMASVDFGGTFNPTNTANQFLEKQKSRSKQVGNVTLATVSGAITGIKTGQGALVGAKVGAKHQLRNVMYQSQLGIDIIREIDVKTDRAQDQVCNMCYKRFNIEEKQIAFRDDEGNYYCVNCADEMGTEELYEVIIGEEEEKEKDLPGVNRTRTKIATTNRSYLSHSKTRDMMNSKVIDGNYQWETDKVESLIKDNLTRLREDSLVFSNVRLLLGHQAKPPSIPEPLHSYIDLAFLNEAWGDKNLELVESTYKEAWKMWYQDNGEFVDGLSQESIDKFKNEIDEFSPEIDIVSTKKILNDYQGAKSSPKAESDTTHMYTYKNGKLTFEKIGEEVANEPQKLKKKSKPKDAEPPKK